MGFTRSPHSVILKKDIKTGRSCCIRSQALNIHRIGEGAPDGGRVGAWGNRPSLQWQWVMGGVPGKRGTHKPSLSPVLEPGWNYASIAVREPVGVPVRNPCISNLGGRDPQFGMNSWLLESGFRGRLPPLFPLFPLSPGFGCVWASVGFTPSPFFGGRKPTLFIYVPCHFG